MEVPRNELGHWKKGFTPNPGGRPAKTAKLRKAFAKRDKRALEVLDEFFASSDVELRLEALKLWAKYRLPVPTEKAPDMPGPSPFRLSPETAAKLAALEMDS